MAALYRRGGFGYGHVKTALADSADKYFAEARARRQELTSHPEHMREILADGAAKARHKAPGSDRASEPPGSVFFSLRRHSDGRLNLPHEMVVVVGFRRGALGFRLEC